VGLTPTLLLLGRLGGFWRLLGRCCGELPRGHGLLHDYLVFASVLVSKIGHLAPELGYECGVVRVYPFVLYIVYPSSIPCVQEDVHPPVLFLFVLQGPASNPLADGALGDPEPSGRFLDRETVYPASIPFVHGPMLDH
jgi:hypothetical protein